MAEKSESLTMNLEIADVISGTSHNFKCGISLERGQLLN